MCKITSTGRVDHSTKDKGQKLMTDDDVNQSPLLLTLAEILCIVSFATSRVSKCILITSHFKILKYFMTIVLERILELVLILYSAGVLIVLDIQN